MRRSAAASACTSIRASLPLKSTGDAIAAGEIYAELGEVVSGAKPMRESAEEITLFKSGGLAVEDVAAADLIYRKAANIATAENVFDDSGR
jgi:alanine dehydrogenase